MKWFPKTHCILILSCLMLVSGGCSGEPASATSDPAKPIITGKFTPPEGKTLMIIGQDSETIADYQRAVPQDNLEGVTLYTMLKSPDPKQTLHGVFSTGNWNSGDVNFGDTLQAAPDAVLAIGLAFDDCNDEDHSANIAAGHYDKSLQTLVDYLQSIAPRKVLLRAGYEFDGMWNCYEPATYKAAFRHIAQAMKAADNVAMVWQSAAWPAPQFAGDRTHLYDHNDPQHIAKWYPGDDVVDWISISSFYRDDSRFNFELTIHPVEAQQLYVDFARAKQIPLMISEAAPQSYRTEKQTQSFIALNTQTPLPAEQIWQDWYQRFFDFIYDNRDVIRAVAYINTHWESQSRWYCAPDTSPPDPQCPEGNWGDSRVQGHPFIKAQWLEQVNNDALWIQSGAY